MTPIMLVDDLIDFLKPVVANYELDSNVKGVRKPPQVLGGFLPDKRPTQQQETPDFPWVIVRYIEDDDTEESNMATVKIMAGTYSEDPQNGWRDALNVITRIKQELLKHPTVKERFRIEKPIKTELPEEQPYPEWVAWMTFQVEMPQIEEEGVMYKW